MKLLYVKCFSQVQGQSVEEINYGDYEEGTTVSPDQDYYTDEPESKQLEETEEMVHYSSKQKADMEELCMEKTKLDPELKDLVKYYIFVEKMQDYLMCVMRDSKAWLPTTGFSMPHVIALYRLKGLTDEMVKDILETCIDKNKSSEDLYDYVVSLQCCVIDCTFREQFRVKNESN